MAEGKTITGFCPKCGKELQIPEDLPQFACMYCGTKMNQDQLLPTAPMAVSPAQGDAQAEFDYVKAHILACVTKYPDSYKHINKKEFVPYSDEYLETCRPVFDHLEQCARIEPDQSDLWGVRAAEELMLQLNGWFEQQKGWRQSYRRKNIIDSAKFTIALFLIPMLSRINLVTARPFAQKLNEMWLTQYPQSPFTLATYQDLAGGFRKHMFCFITTAICQAEGKPDDCAELTAFRDFRDGWLRQQPDGEALIETYYDIAPAIVMCMDYCDDSKACYAQLRREYLQPCYQALQQGRMEDCKTSYVAMVRQMQKRYLEQ